MRFSKPALMGAGLGFVMGLVFLVISLFQFDDAQTNTKDVVLAGVLIGVPFSVLIGIAIGWVWGKFLGPNSL